MFAVALNLPAILSVGGIVVVGILAAGVLGVGTFAVARAVKARRAAKASGAVKAAPKTLSLPGMLGNLGSIDLTNLPPEVKQIINVLLPAVHQAQQTVVNAAVAKMFPWAAPFIPGIDRAIVSLDNVIDNKLGIGGGNDGTPSAPSSVVIPAGHPVLDLLHKMLEAEKQRMQAGK